MYITAKCQQRFRNNPDAYDLVIKKIEFLSDVKDKSIDKLTIYIDSTLFKDSSITDLQTMLQSNKGQVPLYFNIHDTEHNTNIEMYSSKVTVDVNKRLLNFLDDMDKQSGELHSVRYAIN